MRRKRVSVRPWTLKQRSAFIFVGLLIMGWGIVTLLQGKLHYQNYWHAPVFAPFAVLIGVLMVFAAIKRRPF
jgi:hypothetical protein